MQSSTLVPTCTWVQSSNRKGEYFQIQCLTNAHPKRIPQWVNIYKLVKKKHLALHQLITCPYCGSKTRIIGLKTK